MKYKNTITLAILMLVPFKNTPGYKENIITFIEFDFGEGVVIIDWIANMKPCV